MRELLHYAQWTYTVILSSVTSRCVIPIVCVTNEREESVVNQQN